MSGTVEGPGVTPSEMHVRGPGPKGATPAVLHGSADLASLEGARSN